MDERNEEFEELVDKLKNIDTIRDIKDNPVVSSIVSVGKQMPFLGNLIDTIIDGVINEFQKNKRHQLLDLILYDQENITSDMVSDVEFIINFMKVLESVNRLATNDKIQFFANLIRNGYLSSENKKIECNDFDEFHDILCRLSFREIKYLIFMWNNASYHDGKLVNKQWVEFKEIFSREFPDNDPEIVYKRLSRTAFISEVIETASVDEDDFLTLDIQVTGYEFSGYFRKFYDMVLKIDE